ERRRAATGLYTRLVRVGDLQEPSPTRGFSRRGPVLVDAPDGLGATVVDAPVLGIRVAGQAGRAQRQRHRHRISGSAATITGSLLSGANRKTFARSEPPRMSPGPAVANGSTQHALRKSTIRSSGCRREPRQGFGSLGR